MLVYRYGNDVDAHALDVEENDPEPPPGVIEVPWLLVAKADCVYDPAVPVDISPVSATVSSAEACE